MLYLKVHLSCGVTTEEVPGIPALLHGLNISASAMKLALNEDLCYYSYKHCRGQLLPEKACEKCNKCG